MTDLRELSRATLERMAREPRNAHVLPAIQRTLAERGWTLEPAASVARQPVPGVYEATEAEQQPHAILPEMHARTVRWGKRRGEMNKTEERYAATFLADLPEGCWWEYETVRLAVPGMGGARKDGSAAMGWFLGDFSVWSNTAGGLLLVAIHECKGARLWPDKIKNFLASAKERAHLPHIMRQWKGGAWHTLYDLNRGQQ